VEDEPTWARALGAEAQGNGPAAQATFARAGGRGPIAGNRSIPPAANKYHYWTNDACPGQARRVFAGANADRGLYG